MRALLSIFVLSIFNIVAAQDDEAKIVVFDSFNEQTKSSVNTKNAIEFDFLSPASGDIKLLYQRSVTDILAVYGSLGVTTRDYLNEVVEDDYYYGYDDISEEHQLGRSLGLGVRIFPSEDIDGYYVSVGYRYRNYESDFLDGSVVLANEYRILNDYRIGFGGNFFLDDRIYFGSAAYFGLRSKEIQDVSIYEDWDSATSSYIPTVDIVRQSTMSGLFTLEWSFGVAF